LIFLISGKTILTTWAGDPQRGSQRNLRQGKMQRLNAIKPLCRIEIQDRH
jgi:hypothetical protein